MRKYNYEELENMLVNEGLTLKQLAERVGAHPVYIRRIMSWRTRKKICEQCGNAFEAISGNRKYCGPACKAKACRLRKEMNSS